MKENNYSWVFSCIDNGRKRQSFTVKASNKNDAEIIGFRKARKNAHGDIISWDCKLSNIISR